jgi:hypothetical protein
MNDKGGLAWVTNQLVRPATSRVADRLLLHPDRCLRDLELLLGLAARGARALGRL